MLLPKESCFTVPVYIYLYCCIYKVTAHYNARYTCKIPAVLYTFVYSVWGVVCKLCAMIILYTLMLCPCIGSLVLYQNRSHGVVGIP